MKTPTKPCKAINCPQKRYGTSTLCRSHYLAKVRSQCELKASKAKERKVRTKKYQKSEIKKWHRKCWVLMSEWVRRKDADWRGYTRCYTSGRYLPWNELHCGHYIHGKLDFDERNLKPQTAADNTYHGGRLDVYTLNLIRDYGIEWVKQLRRDADQHPGYSLEDLKKIYADLQQKLSAIKRLLCSSPRKSTSKSSPRRTRKSSD